MDISVIIPAFNESESLPELCHWIKHVMNVKKYSYEIIIVDDGSTDRTWETVKSLKKENKNISGICFRRNYGKSAALYCGFNKAQGEVVITMDADLQDSPDEVPELYRMVMEEGYDLVSGWKQKRYDNALMKDVVACPILVTEPPSCTGFTSGLITIGSVGSL